MSKLNRKIEILHHQNNLKFLIACKSKIFKEQFYSFVFPYKGQMLIIYGDSIKRNKINR